MQPNGVSDVGSSWASLDASGKALLGDGVSVEDAHALRMSGVAFIWEAAYTSRCTASAVYEREFNALHQHTFAGQYAALYSPTEAWALLSSSGAARTRSTVTDAIPLIGTQPTHLKKTVSTLTQLCSSLLKEESVNKEPARKKRKTAKEMNGSYSVLLENVAVSARSGDMGLCTAVLEKAVMEGNVGVQDALRNTEQCVFKGPGVHIVLPEHCFQAIGMFHTFFTVRSFARYDRFLVASACMLASYKASRILPCSPPVLKGVQSKEEACLALFVCHLRTVLGERYVKVPDVELQDLLRGCELAVLQACDFEATPVTAVTYVPSVLRALLSVAVQSGSAEAVSTLHHILHTLGIPPAAPLFKAAFTHSALAWTNHILACIHLTTTLPVRLPPYALAYLAVLCALCRTVTGFRGEASFSPESVGVGEWTEHAKEILEQAVGEQGEGEGGEEEGVWDALQESAVGFLLAPESLALLCAEVGQAVGLVTTGYLAGVKRTMTGLLSSAAATKERKRRESEQP